MPQLLRALGGIDPEEIRLVVAGRVASREAEELIRLPHSTYLGELGHVEALAWYFAVDVAFTFYDPAVAINRLAAPNKWGDCAATRTPFIVNEEVVTARAWLEQDAAFSVPFHDSGALREALVELAANRSLIEGAVMKSPFAGQAAATWDVEMKRVLWEWLAEEPLS